MVTPRLVTTPAASGLASEPLLRAGIEALRTELEVNEEFPPEVLACAVQAAASPRLPSHDLTALEFVTLDPLGARDLDQALHLARTDSGFVVHYAIADLGAFITPGDPVDEEANRRGQTLYGADSKVPLHPKVISEDAGSLLADEVRPAVVWTIELDAAGEVVTASAERALVRSRAQLDYAGVQAAFDDGVVESLPAGASTMALLAEVGPLRLAQEARRGGVSLPMPEQEVHVEDGRWSLEFRSMTDVEEWNAQISLLTGICAARMMMDATVGVVRTLPPADPRDVARLRRTARALGVEWAPDTPYPDFVRSLDPTQPRHAALVVACTRLFRGSGYAVFSSELPDVVEHAAVASVYAHVTAPLRRLVDRYGTEICVALSAGEPVPDWVLARLDELPGTMRRTGQLAGKYERGVLDLTEAVLLADRVGETFDAVVVEVDDKKPERGEITIEDPAIEAKVSSGAALPLGDAVTVRLTEADVATRTVRFEVA